MEILKNSLAGGIEKKMPCLGKYRLFLGMEFSTGQ